MDKFLEVQEICFLYGFDLNGPKDYSSMQKQDAKLIQEYLREQYDNMVDLI